MENKSRALLNTLFSSMPVGVVMVDAEGTVHVSWRLGVRLDRALRTEGLAALVLEQPLLYRLTGACRGVLYPVGQTKTITLYLTRQQAEELADVLLPVTDPLWHAPKGGEKLAFTVLGANGQNRQQKHSLSLLTALHLPPLV